jgi:hypothetical protein
MEVTTTLWVSDDVAGLAFAAAKAVAAANAGKGVYGLLQL